MFDIRKMQEKAIYLAVKAECNEEVAKGIVYGAEGQGYLENNPTWVNATMKRLENEFDQTTLHQLRRNCQCGYGMDEKLALVRELMAESSSLEEFGNLDQAKAAGLFWDQGELYLQFFFCPCPILEEVNHLETDTWCQCTTGYSKVLFEMAFKCRVEVELLKSIKMGADRCLMKIIPREKFCFKAAKRE